MKITDLKQQVKRADRYSIFIDGKFKFSLSSDELLTKGLFLNKELDDKELKSLIESSSVSLAKANCFRYISYRQRSFFEINQYLKLKGYSEKVIKETLLFLSEKKLIDDVKFAKTWVENRNLLKPTSIRQLKLELRQKKVDPEIIQDVVNDQTIDDREIIRGLIKKKQSQTKYRDKLKLMQFLARRGFNYEDIKSVLSDIRD